MKDHRRLLSYVEYSSSNTIVRKTAMFFSLFHQHKNFRPRKRSGVKAAERSGAPVGLGLDATERRGIICAADGRESLDLNIMAVPLEGADE
jgi:hypothetical protein